MHLFSSEAFEHLIEGASVLREDLHGPKVYQLADGRIAKLFRIKRWLSLSVLYPYSVRFYHNAQRLRHRGVCCVDAEQTFYCHAVRRHGVVYQRLQGTALDSLFAENSDQARAVFLQSAVFIAGLHRMRIYFRSLHPGNILLLPEGGFGLIDVADLRFPLFRLGIEQRRRNFRHLFRSREFADASKLYSVEQFILAYLQASDLAASERQRLGDNLLQDWNRQAA